MLDEAGVEFGRTARLFVNPGGPFVVGGPRRDAGLTGRKNTIDTYGGYSRHGGGALSGKDPDHIDRLGAYAARHVASNLVAAGLCAECEVHLAYAIGQAQPLTVSVQTFGTGVTPDEALARVVEETMDLRPAAILKQFRLRELPAQHEGALLHAAGLVRSLRAARPGGPLGERGSARRAGAGGAGTRIGTRRAV